MSLPSPGCGLLFPLRRVDLNVERDRLHCLHREGKGSDVKAARPRGKGEIQGCDLRLGIRLIFRGSRHEGYSLGYDRQLDGVGRKRNLVIRIEDADMNLEEGEGRGAGRDFSDAEADGFQPNLEHSVFLLRRLRKNVCRSQSEQKHPAQEREKGGS